MAGLLLTNGIIGESAWYQVGLMLIIFIIVLALAYYVSRFIGVKNRHQSYKSNITIIETAHLAQGIWLQIVKVGKTYLILGVTKDKVDKLGEITEDDLDLSKNTNENQFKGIIEKYMHLATGNRYENGDNTNEEKK